MANMTTCPLPTGASTTWALPARPCPPDSTPERSMSVGFWGKLITTRGRASSLTRPNCRAMARSAAASEAAAPPPGGPARLALAGAAESPTQGDIDCRAAIGVMFWLGPPPPPRKAANSAGTPAPPALSTGSWLKYTGSCVPSKPYAIGLFLSLMTPRMTEPRTKRPAGCSTVTPLVMPNAGKIVAVEPSTRSVPPSRTNFVSSVSPSRPMPPRMSSDSSSAPRLGVSADFLYGSAAGPVFGRPLTCATAEPPMCGNTITSYCARRLPSRSFWSAKYL